MWLFDELLASDLPEDTWVANALQRYFPQRLHGEFATDIERHPLRREIIATVVLNEMVNRVGPSFPHQMTSSTGSTPAQVVRAYLLTREVFALESTWASIEALDNVVADQTQAELLMELAGARCGPPRGSCARGAWPNRWHTRSSAFLPRRAD